MIKKTYLRLEMCMRLEPRRRGCHCHHGPYGAELVVVVVVVAIIVFSLKELNISKIKKE